MERRERTVALIIFIFLILQTTTISNAENNKKIIVDQNGTGHYTTIQEAIDNAEESDTIYIKAGTYKEILNIRKKISLIGENKETTIINPISLENRYAVRLGAPETILKSLSIKNGAPGLYTNGIRLTADKITVEDCIIYETPIGIAIWTSYNKIKNCIFYSCKDEGIALLGNENSNCNNNKITNCEFYENCDGIELQYSSNNEITDCTFFDNTHTAIDAIAKSNNENIISNCKIYNNRVHGIYLSKSSNNEIKDCSIYENKDGDIFMDDYSKNNNIINSEIKYNELLYPYEENNIVKTSEKKNTFIDLIINRFVTTSPLTSFFI